MATAPAEISKAVVQKPDSIAERLQQEARDIAQQALAIKQITNDQEYEKYGTMGTTITRVDVQVEEFFKPLKEPAHAAWKALCDRESGLRNPLKAAKQHLSTILGNYRTEQERKRREEEERLRLEDQRREEEARLNQAALLEKQGRKEEAEEVLNQPSIPAAVTLPSSLPKVAGVTGRGTKYIAEVFDLMALCKAVVEKTVPLQAICPDQKFLDQQANAFKGVLQYPGVRTKDKSGVSFRR